MGDENTALTIEEARHMLRRTGFGARPADVNALVGVTRGAAADALLNFTPTNFRPGGPYVEASHNRWLKYMVRTPWQLQEKLTIFWHDHFATAVADAKLMSFQNRLLRKNCRGNFKSFVKAINTNPAMMTFLNTVDNTAANPNENYARELQELFTLGVYDFAGVPNYTQADIVQVARAFSGWDYDYPNSPYLDPSEHDDGTPKTIYTAVGGFGGSGRDITENGSGEVEIDTVIDIIFDHEDTQGKNTVARHITRKLMEYFAHPNPSTGVVDALIASSNFDGSTNAMTAWELTPLLRAIFVHDAFYESAAAAPFGVSTKKSVKWPIDFVVGTMRHLRMKFRGRYPYVSGGAYGYAYTTLQSMGQVLLDPPSVFGWDWEERWLSSATLLARYQFIRDVTSARDGGKSAFHPQTLIPGVTNLTDPTQIVTAVTDYLGITDQFVSSERQRLIDYLTDEGANPSIDLNDYEIRNVKLHGLFALVMQSAQYQLH